MPNWRLLLLAFLAVLHPITSFAERSLVNGREQCCDRNSVLRGSRLAYESLRSNKLSEDRRLSQTGIREDRRHDMRSDSTVIARPSADRREVEFRSVREVRRISPDRTTTRFSRTEFQRENIIDNRRTIPDEARRVRDAHRISSRDISRDMRSRDVARMRNSRESNIRHNERDSRELSHERASRDNRITRGFSTERRFRDSMDSRRESRRVRDNSGEVNRVQESREVRDVLQRGRHDVTRKDISRDRRLDRESGDERRAWSESRLQLNRDRRSLDRRVSETNEERRSSYRSNSMDRIRNVREDSRSNQMEIRERSDERRQNREENRGTREKMMSQDLRVRNLEERKNLRESADRSRRVVNGNTRFERAETRRESRVDERRFRVRSLEDRPVTDMRHAESRRMTDKDSARDLDVVLERRDRRTVERRDIRDLRREVRMSRTLDSRGSDVSSNRAEYRITKNSVRELNDARLRTNDRLMIRGNSASIREKQLDEQATPMNWQYAFYTLQGLYLCGLLMQMLSQNESGKQSRVFSWLSTPRSLIKVD